MRIANPIYSSVFKYLLDDEKVAKLLLSALLGHPVLDLQSRNTEVRSRRRESVLVLQRYFEATVQREDGGSERVLIEIQKAQNPLDVLRSRQYQGNKFGQADGQGGPQALPMVTVCFLDEGPEQTDAPVVRVNRDDMETASVETIRIAEPFVEALTHDCILVQINRLRDRRRTELERLLMVFDQGLAERGNPHFLEVLEEGEGSAVRRDLALELLATRQQLAVYRAQRPRPRLPRDFKAFWILLRRLWPRWKSACILVKPETVVGWHRAGFRLSERTVSRFMPKRGPQGNQLLQHRQNWMTFLRNHREVIAAMDFLVVSSWRFTPIYVLVILDHGRRIVRHCNVTAHPTSDWVKQQLREAFPFDQNPRYLIHDRDTTFGSLTALLEAMGIREKRTAYHSPWQNGFVERMHGSLRRDLLDHIIPLDEDHLRRLLKEYLRYYHEDRTHLGLGKDCPRGRPVETKPGDTAQVAGLPRCGGLHHRYVWLDAA